MPYPKFKHWLIACTALFALVATSCSSGDSSDDSKGDGSGAKIVIAYSAWPGWFPLSVAEEKKTFEGLNVEFRYFASYTASLSAFNAGKVDVIAQTLSDTLISVGSGVKQKVIVVTDNSTGNDAIICDKSIDSIESMKGKTVAAELGVVDHFLLLQGLATKGLTEKDVNFTGVATDAAAAGFAAGQFDCVGVFAPFTTQALERPGSHVVFDSSEFPGAIPDLLVASDELVAKRPAEVQKLVDGWYSTLELLSSDAAGSTAIMAEKAALSSAEYEALAKGTTLFSAEVALKAFEDRKGDTTSLIDMSRQIGPFLTESKMVPSEPDTTGLFDSTFTKKYLDSK